MTLNLYGNHWQVYKGLKSTKADTYMYITNGKRGKVQNQTWPCA